jgi:hypothetical protein
MLYSRHLINRFERMESVMVDSLLDPKTTKRGRAAGRLTRTILLGTVAVAFALYWLADSYGVDPADLIKNLKTSLLFVAVFVGMGIVGGVLLWLLRRLRASRSPGG